MIDGQRQQQEDQGNDDLRHSRDQQKASPGVVKVGNKRKPLQPVDSATMQVTSGTVREGGKKKASKATQPKQKQMAARTGGGCAPVPASKYGPMVIKLRKLCEQASIK
jgi:hypothetical protein